MLITGLPTQAVPAGTVIFMNERMFALGARLSACAGFVRPGMIAADIGTDHAKLPIWLVSEGVVPKAIASDINQGPIESARRNIARYGLGDKIDTYIGSGLDTVAPGMAQDIIIAGMGGELIASILSGAEWVKSSEYRLILQPMSHPERLREWLFENAFAIADEQAVVDANKIYTVICAEYSGKVTAYTQYDTYAGGLAGKADELSRSFLQRQAKQIRINAQGLRRAGNEELAQQLEKTAKKLEV